MILKPYSFNGTSLQSATFKASFPKQQATAQVMSQPGYIKRAGAYPIYAGKDISPHTLSIEIIQATVMTDLDTLNALFDTQDETPRQFICTDTEDSDKQYYVYATPTQVMGGHEGTMAIVTLALDDPIWQSVTQNSQTWSSTSTTSTTDVTVGGNDDAFPIFEITPTSAPSTDFIFTSYIQILPTSANPWTARPLCITGDTSTTWDTAALVAAGKMQADGDDIRVYKNGIKTDFWISGINTTDTKIWITCDMPEARNMTLKTAIGATDTVTEVVLQNTTANKNYIQDMPNRGLLIIDSSLGSTDTEEFSYTAKTITDTKLAFTINARNNRNTTALAHAAAANVRHLPNSFRIDYGSATATAPTIDDTHKPIINLSTSNNTSFVYATFYDNAAARAGIWKPVVSFQSDPVASRSEYFTSTSDEGDTDPATEMGLTAKTYQSGGSWRADTVFISWRGDFPDYISSFSASGEQSQTATAIPDFGMAYVNPVTNINTFLWTLSAQATTDYGTFTAWSKATTDATVPPNLETIRWLMKGSILGTTDYYAKAGIAALTVNLTNNPHVMMRAESGVATINLTIANTTTGESIDLLLPVDVNDTVYVDTDPDFPTVTYKGELINGALKTSSIRACWLKFQTGSNTLTLDNSQPVANDFSIAIKWRDRANFF